MGFTPLTGASSGERVESLAQLERSEVVDAGLDGTGISELPPPDATRGAGRTGAAACSCPPRTRSAAKRASRPASTRCPRSPSGRLGRGCAHRSLLGALRRPARRARRLGASPGVALRLSSGSGRCRCRRSSPSSASRSKACKRSRRDWPSSSRRSAWKSARQSRSAPLPRVDNGALDRQLGHGVGDPAELPRPVVAAPRVDRRLAAGEVRLHPVAIPFDFVDPDVSRRWFLLLVEMHRFDEWKGPLGHRRQPAPRRRGESRSQRRNWTDGSAFTQRKQRRNV